MRLEVCPRTTIRPIQWILIVIDIDPGRMAVNNVPFYVSFIQTNIWTFEVFSGCAQRPIPLHTNGKSGACQYPQARCRFDYAEPHHQIAQKTLWSEICAA